MSTDQKNPGLKPLFGQKFVSYAESEGLTDDDFQRSSNVAIHNPPQLDEESSFAFLTNLFFYKSTAIEHVYPQLILVWVMCAISNVVYWATKGYKGSKLGLSSADDYDDMVDVDDDDDDDSGWKLRPSSAWIPLDVEAMHGIVGQVS